MSDKNLNYNISEEDLQSIKSAKYVMKNIGWAIKIVNYAGSGIEFGVKKLPVKVVNAIQKATEKTLLAFVKANLMTISKKKKFRKPSIKTYKAIMTGSGATSGFFGATTGYGTLIFLSEATFTTKFILRSIMDIARSEGEDIYTLEGQLECLQVFALGGESKDDDGVEAGYYASRAALQSSLKEITASGIKAAIEVLVKSTSVLGSNAVTRFIAKIAARLSIIITEKFVAQAVPIVGAIGGGSVNLIFVNHFQKMAKAHFTIRRLERKYGQEIVKNAYNEILIDQQ